MDQEQNASFITPCDDSATAPVTYTTTTTEDSETAFNFAPAQIPEGKDGLEFLVGVGKEIQRVSETPQVLRIEGETYVFFNGEVVRYTPVDGAAPDTFTAYSLAGLIEWIKCDINGHFTEDAPTCVAHIIGPTEVRVETPCEGYAQRSYALAVCKYGAPQLPYDRRMDAEEFVIKLQTLFVENEKRDLVLRVVQNMREEQSMETADNGISQRVEIKQGVQGVDKAIFQNPAYLRPMRTFPEINQPESPFILRFHSGPMVALYEADAGKWRVDAVRAIGEYLREALAGLNVVVIA